MRMEMTQDGSRIVIALQGDVVFTTRDEFESELRRIMEKAVDMVLDLERVDFIDSSGVAAILAACEDARLAGITFRIKNVAPDLLEIFELIGVKDVLPFD